MEFPKVSEIFLSWEKSKHGKWRVCCYSHWLTAVVIFGRTQISLKIQTMLFFLKEYIIHVWSLSSRSHICSCTLRNYMLIVW